MSEHIYQPQKLLLSNLFLCLNIEIEVFSTDIYDQIINDINSNVEVIKEYINRNYENNKSIIPYSLVREIDKELQKCSSLLEKQKNNEQVKLPDYCLFGIYKLLQGLINSIEKNSFQKYIFLPGYKGDMDSIEKYEECVSGYVNLDVEPVSLKSLKKILNPNMNPYNDKQIEIVKYILKNVIPKLLFEKENKFFRYIDNGEWGSVIFNDLKSSEKVLFYDDHEDIINELNNSFECIKDNSNDVEKIGTSLIKIFDNIFHLCNSDKLSLTPKKNNLMDSYNEETISNNGTYTNYDYDGILSTYILKIIERFSVIVSAFSEEKKLTLVDNIISNNRDDIIKFFEENNQNNVIINPDESGIFSDNNTNLRNILVEALLNEPEILNSYNTSIDNGGNDE